MCVFVVLPTCWHGRAELMSGVSVVSASESEGGGWSMDRGRVGPELQGHFLMHVGLCAHTRSLTGHRMFLFLFAIHVFQGSSHEV